MKAKEPESLTTIPGSIATFTIDPHSGIEGSAPIERAFLTRYPGLAMNSAPDPLLGTPITAEL